MVSHRTLIRLIYLSLLLLVIASTSALVLLAKSKQLVFEDAVTAPPERATTSIAPFPVSVDPARGEILPTELTGDLSSEEIALRSTQETWWQRLFAALVNRTWYQNLAAPVSRVIVIWPGERKEEAAQNIGGVLRWDSAERARFIELITTADPVLPEGTFYPDQYVTHRHATPEEIATLIQDTFTREVLTRYTPEVEALVPLADALTIASLLEREASDFENMREISGVIWNRLFIDMPLQLDATLQYARGSRPYEPEWWPVPRPRDKFIESPYNTYANPGLPPSPIANPSAAAVVAALNPIPTDCLYYFHGPDQAYYCSETYEEHNRKLRTAYNL